MQSHWTTEYLGKPYETAAYGPDAYDCYGIIVAVYAKHLQIQLPKYPLEDVANLLKVGKLIEHEKAQRWKKVEEPVDFDVLELATNRRTFHVGIAVWLDGKLHVLHAVDEMGVVLTDKARLKTVMAMRIVGVLRHVETN